LSAEIIGILRNKLPIRQVKRPRDSMIFSGLETGLAMPLVKRAAKKRTLVLWKCILGDGRRFQLIFDRL
jgi:hypothetical protein